MKTNRAELEQGFEERLEANLGYEMVQLEWAGNTQRPVIRLRVEHRVPGPSRFARRLCTHREPQDLEAWLDRGGPPARALRARGLVAGSGPAR